MNTERLNNNSEVMEKTNEMSIEFSKIDMLEKKNYNAIQNNI